MPGREIVSKGQFWDDHFHGDRLTTSCVPLGKNTAMEKVHAATEPNRAEVDALPGATLLEFGASWCGWCQGAEPLIAAALAAHPRVRHIKVEDGSGRLLGRSFGVRLWPTLVLVRDGIEVGRVTRPRDAAAMAQVFRGLDSASPPEAAA
jgi:thioredoxin 1